MCLYKLFPSRKDERQLCALVRRPPLESSRPAGWRNTVRGYRCAPKSKAPSSPGFWTPSRARSQPAPARFSTKTRRSLSQAVLVLLLPRSTLVVPADPPAPSADIEVALRQADTLRTLAASTGAKAVVAVFGAPGALTHESNTTDRSQKCHISRLCSHENSLLLLFAHCVSVWQLGVLAVTASSACSTAAA